MHFHIYVNLRYSEREVQAIKVIILTFSPVVSNKQKKNLNLASFILQYFLGEITHLYYIFVIYFCQSL